MPPQASKTELRAGSLLSGKYKLQRQLGRGASGAVWAAINVTTSRQVALKVLLRPEPKARERLLREARAAGALKHPNVVDVYDVIVAEDGSPALVLEFLEGQTLEQLILERAPLPPVEVASIARDVARALAVAHASGIVHRDLKPANIFLHRPSEDDAPIVKVVDFGISKNLLTHEQTLTETGMAVGSPSFMSPEQVRGERTLDGRTDLWALGVIMHEMLSGKRLFDGRAHEVLTMVLVQPIKPLREIVVDLDPAIERVVMGLLVRDLGKRLASAEDVANQLSAFVVGSGSVRPTDSPPSRGQPHDTSVVHVPLQVPKASAVPQIHEDDADDDEATHVAPMMMRQALAKKTVPSVYQDDEDEEEADRTRVAPDAVLTAAIKASREPSPDATSSESDQNTIPTVRPPGLARAESDAPGGNTLPDAPELTSNGTQKLAVEKIAAARPAGAAAPKPAANKPLGEKTAIVRPAPAKALAAPRVSPEKAPVGPPPAQRSAAAQRPYVGSAPMKAHAMGHPADKPSATKPAHAEPAATPAHPSPAKTVSEAPPFGAPHSEKTPAVAPHPDWIPHARAHSEKAPAPTSERSSRPPPTSPRVPVVGPPDADVDEEAISERSPSVRPMAPDELSAPKVLIDKAVSERAPSLHGASDHASPQHAPHTAGLAGAPSDSAAHDSGHSDKPSAVETAVHKVPGPRSDALITWIVTILVAALLILAAYLYTHRTG